MYSASAALRARWAIVLVLLVLVSSVVPPPPLEFIDPDLVQGVLDTWTMIVFAASLGQAQRHSRRRALRLERNRIAREMHDIVAHGLSLIAVRAGVARTVLTTDPAQVAESITVIEQASRESLAETRTVLGVLRSSEKDGDSGPQPGLDHIPDLVERARESGLMSNVVSIRIAVEPPRCSRRP